jgi:predicted enzyme related to lactoylglutathione lyase
MTYTLDYLEFSSGDGQASQKFFAEAFGWSMTSYGPEYAAIDDAGIDVGIHSAEKRVAEPLAIVQTTDLKKAYTDVVAAGGVIVKEPYDFPGGRRFHFREPGGNELAVWTQADE